MKNQKTSIKPANIGYKVMNPDMTCRGFKFEIGKTYTHEGQIELCGSGFHFCMKLNHCFHYYSFDPNNRVFEIQFGEAVEHGDDKSVTNGITIVREIDWSEVLVLTNAGHSNTGHSNSGNWNSGNRNSGDRNSGDINSGNRNSGDSNSGDRNSGNINSGDRNSGNWNSGNWNSGNRNSGDSNSGYRNSGAFCTDSDPVLWLFDKPTNITVRQWEQMEPCRIMNSIDLTIWVPGYMMSEEEKTSNPNWETTEGYLKAISMHEAWSNVWGNLSDDKKQVFLDLPNFDADKFLTITGIDTTKS